MSGGQNRVNLEGQKFGRLLAIAPTTGRKSGNVIWFCECKCGNEVFVNTSDLRSGNTRSCGCISRIQNTEPGEAALHHLYHSYRRGAEHRDLKFNLSKEDFAELTKQECLYCGIAPSKSIQAHYSTPYIYNGIDRVDNSKGYNLDNCVPCCTQCNRAKNDLSLEEWSDWLSRIVSHNETLSGTPAS